jgi:hypothetical protein
MSCTLDTANRVIMLNTGLTVAVLAGEPVAITLGSFTNPIT